MDEKISKLHPKIRDEVQKIILEVESLGIFFKVYSTYRSAEQQLIEYGKGRNREKLEIDKIDPKYSDMTKPIVTNAKPYESYHNYGLALDGVVIEKSKAVWDSEKINEVVKVFKKYGYKWGGDFNSIKDKPHFEKSFGFSVKSLKEKIDKKEIKNGYVII